MAKRQADSILVHSRRTLNRHHDAKASGSG